MGKPYGGDFRADILGTFDATPVQSITDVVNRLTTEEFKPSYQSTRNMMQKMSKEGTLQELPKRGPKNKVYYVKGFFKNITRFADQSGNNVSLKEFIHKLTDSANDPKLIDSAAMMAIKQWMLDSLGVVIPESYAELNRPIPVAKENKKKLETVLAMTKEFHAFVKQFIDADIWSPVAQERIALEFKSTCVEEHAMIVDKSWKEKK